MAESFEYFRKQHLKYVQKAHQHLQCWSQRSARAQFRTGQRPWCCAQPDYRANFMHEPANVTQMISIVVLDRQFVLDKLVTLNSRGLKGQTNLGRIVGGNTHKNQSTFNRNSIGSACSQGDEKKPSFPCRSPEVGRRVINISSRRKKSFRAGCRATCSRK